MYIPLRRVVLSLPTEDETPEEFEQTVMIGHAAAGTPQAYTQYTASDPGRRKYWGPIYTIYYDLYDYLTMVCA